MQLNIKGSAVSGQSCCWSSKCTSHDATLLFLLSPWTGPISPDASYHHPLLMTRVCVLFVCRSYASALFDRTPEEIRLALDVYQQELNRLMQPPAGPPPSAGSQFLNAATSTSVPVSNNSSTSSSASSNNNNHPTNGLPQDLSLPKSAGRSDSSEEGSERVEKDSRSKFHATSKSSENGEANKTPDVVIKTERPELSSSVYMSHSLQNILRPSSTPSPDESPAPASGTGSGGSGGVASPLQRIASITNSLMSQPSNPTLPQVTQRPMKAILPPITQQQFDTYQNLNTEDIVKKVSQSLPTSPPTPPSWAHLPHPVAGPYILVNPPPTRPHSSLPCSMQSIY